MSMDASVVGNALMPRSASPADEAVLQLEPCSFGSVAPTSWTALSSCAPARLVSIVVASSSPCLPSTAATAGSGIRLRRTLWRSGRSSRRRSNTYDPDTAGPGQAFVLNKSDGTWGTPHVVTATLGNDVPALSPSALNPSSFGRRHKLIQLVAPVRRLRWLGRAVIYREPAASSAAEMGLRSAVSWSSWSVSCCRTPAPRGRRSADSIRCLLSRPASLSQPRGSGTRPPCCASIAGTVTSPLC